MLQLEQTVARFPVRTIHQFANREVERDTPCVLAFRAPTAGDEGSLQYLVARTKDKRLTMWETYLCGLPALLDFRTPIERLLALAKSDDAPCSCAVGQAYAHVNCLLRSQLMPLPDFQSGYHCFLCQICGCPFKVDGDDAARAVGRRCLGLRGREYLLLMWAATDVDGWCRRPHVDLPPSATTSSSLYGPEDAPTAEMRVEMLDDELCKLAEEPLIRAEVRCLKIAGQVSDEAEYADNHL